MKTEMNQSHPIASSEYDIDGGRQMVLKIYEPIYDSNNGAWGCYFCFDAPLNATQTIFGENSLQALVLALKVAASILYGSEFYKEGRIGVFGETGGRLILPAPKEFLNIAPFPF